jgi:hypothetical protein
MFLSAFKLSETLGEPSMSDLLSSSFQAVAPVSPWPLAPDWGFISDDVLTKWGICGTKKKNATKATVSHFVLRGQTTGCGGFVAIATMPSTTDRRNQNNA